MIKLYKFLSIIIISSLIILTSCADDPDDGLDKLITPSNNPPEIISIEPMDGGLAGITVLTINGSNFSPIPENNTVVFNGVKGQVIEVSATQIKVKPPVVISDSVKVKVSVFKVEDFSNIFIYKLLPALIEIYKFDPNNGETPNSITVDAQENVYASLSLKGIKKIDQQGTLSDWAPKGAEEFFNSISFGPDNSIYATRRVKGFFKVNENIVPAVFVSSASGVTENTNDTDFDQNQNIWAASNNAIFRITLAKEVKKFAFSGTAKAIKVIANDIFLVSSTNNDEILWKIPIISSDSIGVPELFFNFTQNIDSSLKINDFVIAADGDIYIGTDALVDPIFTVHPDKSFEILYPGVISSSVNSLVWGNGNFLYMTRNLSSDLTQTVLKINMEKQGAPYYGRQ